MVPIGIFPALFGGAAVVSAAKNSTVGMFEDWHFRWLLGSFLIGFILGVVFG